jgi:hypothetical protein
VRNGPAAEDLTIFEILSIFLLAVQARLDDYQGSGKTLPFRPALGSVIPQCPPTSVDNGLE